MQGPPSAVAGAWRNRCVHFEVAKGCSRCLERITLAQVRMMHGMAEPQCCTAWHVWMNCHLSPVPGAGVKSTA